jgi:hypothetical protein
VLVAADYPFLDVMWTMIVFFLWIAWFWVLIGIIGDIFRRHDIGGWAKAAWILFVVILPLLGVLVYLGVNGAGMGERTARESQAARAQMDDYVRSVAAPTGPAAEIEKAKELLDRGAIDADEYAELKRKALTAATV